MERRSPDVWIRSDPLDGWIPRWKQRFRRRAVRERSDSAGARVAAVPSIMNLKCAFHVTPVSAAPSPPQEVRAKMLTLLHVDIDWEDDQPPRGASIETWRRARGWATED
jgi:hypothetical protein